MAVSGNHQIHHGYFFEGLHVESSYTVVEFFYMAVRSPSLFTYRNGRFEWIWQVAAGYEFLEGSPPRTQYLESLWS